MRPKAQRIADALPFVRLVAQHQRVGISRFREPVEHICIDAGDEVAPPQAEIEIDVLAAEKADDLELAETARAEWKETSGAFTASNPTTIARCHALG